ELLAMADMAGDFLRADGPGRLIGLARELSGLQARPSGTKYSWGIDENWPLVTAESHGRYESGEPGEHRVFAELTSIWDIEPLGQGKRKRTFAVRGKASTRIRLVSTADDGSNTELGMWRMEVAD